MKNSIHNPKVGDLWIAKDVGYEKIVYLIKEYEEFNRTCYEYLLIQLDGVITYEKTYLTITKKGLLNSNPKMTYEKLWEKLV